MPIPKGAAPHIRSKNSVPRIMWTFVLALLPTLFVFLWIGKFNAFRVLAVSAVSSLLSELVMQKILRKRGSLYDGTALLSSLLYALFMPLALPSWQVAAGASFGIIFGKQIFGGLGQNPFHPAAVGCAFVFITFNSSLPFLTLTGIEAYSLLAAATLGGLILISRKVRWEIPILYLAGFVLFSTGLGEKGNIFDWPLLIAAIFLVTDPPTTPISRQGQQWFSLGAGILSAAYSKFFTPFEGVIYAVLFMNALNPWLDGLFRPRPQ